MAHRAPLVSNVATAADGAPGRDPVAGTQAIGRALAVLRVFREGPRDLGVMQVANALGLSPSTTHRIIRALAADGYLTQSGVTDRYSLGREAVLLGLAAQRNLGLDAAQPILERVAAATGESVNMGVRDGNAALVLLRIASAQPLRFDQPPGTRVPLHASSMGKALLAFDGGVESLPQDVPLSEYTSTTITSRPRLARELTAIRSRGFSIDLEESLPGVRCVGAPVCDAWGRAFAAIAVQAPAVRMSDLRLQQLGELVCQAASEVGEALVLSGLHL